MTVIYDAHQVELKKTGKNRYELAVPWESEQKKFWLHFPFPLLSVVDAPKLLRQETKIFTIRADSIRTLPQFLQLKKHHLDYDDSMNLTYDIGNQLQALEMFNMAIPSLRLEEIIVVNDKHYFYMNAHRVLPIESGQLTISVPLKKDFLFSPELKNIESIPSRISYKSGLYSLGVLVTYALTNRKVSETDYDVVLQSITATKLFWALSRLLQAKPEDRFYLII